MGLRFLEHILILMHDPEGTRDWFVQNLGFRDGYHPAFGFPVYWLSIGEQDVIHIGNRYSGHQDTYLKTPTDRADVDYSAAGALGSGRPRRPYAVVALMVLIWFVLGALVDSISIILLTVPVFAPVAAALGFDPIAFAIIGILAIEPACSRRRSASSCSP